MPDYKEMYLVMARAAERAIRILIDAQRQCEEIYVRADETDARRDDGEEQKA